MTVITTITVQAIMIIVLILVLIILLFWELVLVGGRHHGFALLRLTLENRLHLTKEQS